MRTPPVTLEGKRAGVEIRLVESKAEKVAIGMLFEHLAPIQQLCDPFLKRRVTRLVQRLDAAISERFHGGLETVRADDVEMGVGHPVLPVAHPALAAPVV